MLQLSKTKSPNKLFDNDCVTLNTTDIPVIPLKTIVVIRKAGKNIRANKGLPPTHSNLIAVGTF